MCEIKSLRLDDWQKFVDEGWLESLSASLCLYLCIRVVWQVRERSLFVRGHVCVLACCILKLLNGHRLNSILVEVSHFGHI
jgi:hypothetical protein